MIICCLISICQALFVLQSPYQIANTTFSYSISTFGAPVMYSIYGKIIESIPKSCLLSGDLKNNFVLVPNTADCSYEDIALSAQNFGSILIIFKIDKDSTILPKNKFKASRVNIPVIGITGDSYNKIQENLKSTVWASYNYDMIPQKGIIFDIILSGNYSLDHNIIFNVMKFANFSRHEGTEMHYRLSYLLPNDPLVKTPKDDCFSLELSGLICSESVGNITGSQKIKNSILILYALYKSSSYDAILNTQILYENCEFDYSDDCLKKYLKTSLDISVNQFISKDKLSDKYQQSPFLTINNVSFYWPDYLTQAAFLSDLSQKDYNDSCSSMCTNILLRNTICNAGCNYQNCSSDNLKCLYKDGCPSFLLGDGQCDPLCFTDPDCKMCNTGCSYPAMSLGYCPFACTGLCFDNCNKTVWCSPECSYSDLSSDLCPSTCSQTCFDKCNKNIWCSPGCSFSDLNMGICPKSCSNYCQSKCSKLAECSPGCTYSDLSKGICSPLCSPSCLPLCVNSTDICSPGCLYSDLFNKKCSPVCTSECLSLCRNISDECSPDCYYSDLYAGKCSYSCSAKCLTYCKGYECSPGCNRQDWYLGICSSNCSSNCSNNCTSEICSNGCSFQMMRDGYCPVNCSGSCFDSCNKSIYCSPGCRYSDWEVVGPAEACSDDCVDYYKANCYSLCGPNKTCSSTCPDECCLIGGSGSSAKIAYIVVPVIVGVLIISGLVLLCVICRIRKKKMDYFKENPNFSSKMEPSGTAFAKEFHPIEYNKGLDYKGDPVCNIDHAPNII